MYRLLLVPLDGSAFAEQALPVALGIARRAGARVQVVTVVSHSWTNALLSRQSSSELASVWNKYLQGVVERAQLEYGVPVSSLTLEDGDVATRLCAHAQDAAADLVVMSTHGRGALGRFWLGSVAYEIIQRLSTPLLCLKSGDSVTGWGKEPALQHMVITLDGSSLAEQVLEPAITLGALMDADYTLLRVIDDGTVATPELDLISLSALTAKLIAEMRSVHERVKQEAQDYLDRVAERLRARGLRVQTRLAVANDPGTAILDAAAAPEIDLVALETHGNPGVSDRLMGSVARKVIHGTNKPVFVQFALSAKQSNS